MTPQFFVCLIPIQSVTVACKVALFECLQLSWSPHFCLTLFCLLFAQSMSSGWLESRFSSRSCCKLMQHYATILTFYISFKIIIILHWLVIGRIVSLSFLFLHKVTRAGKIIWGKCDTRHRPPALGFPASYDWKQPPKSDQVQLVAGNTASKQVSYSVGFLAS